MLARAAEDEGAVLLVPDDHPSIEEAVQAAEPGDTVRIKPGRYRTAVLLDKDKITIEGTDKQKCILTHKPSLPYMIFAPAAQSVTIRNLTLDGSNASDARFPSVGFRFAPAEKPGVTIEKIDGGSPADRAGIEAGDRLLTVDGRPAVTQPGAHYLIATAGDTVTLEFASRDKPLTLETRPKEISAPARAGIYATGASLTVEQCTIKHIHGGGLTVAAGSTDTVIRNNTVEGNRLQGIGVVSSDAEILSNTCTDNRWRGITIARSSGDMTLKNNRCESNGGAGIAVVGAKGALLEGNVSRGNGRSGFRIGKSTTPVRLRNNRGIENESAGLLILAAGHVRSTGNTYEGNGRAGMNSLQDDAVFITSGDTFRRNENGILIVSGRLEARDVTCSGNREAGIVCQATVKGTITNAVVKDNGGDGISIDSEDTRITVTSSQCNNNAGSGISFEWKAAGSAEGNTCNDNASYGIYVVGDETAPYLAWNTCSGNKAGAINVDEDSNAYVSLGNTGIPWHQTSLPAYWGRALAWVMLFLSAAALMPLAIMTLRRRRARAANTESG